MGMWACMSVCVCCVCCVVQVNNLDIMDIGLGGAKTRYIEWYNEMS